MSFSVGWVNMEPCTLSARDDAYADIESSAYTGCHVYGSSGDGLLIGAGAVVDFPIRFPFVAGESCQGVGKEDAKMEVMTCYSWGSQYRTV
jgi:hypothetical protein